MSRILLIALCGLMAMPAAADPEERKRDGPMIQVDVAVQMDAINESMASISHSVAQISDSFQLIAASGELSPDQQEELSSTLRNLDQLMQATNNSVNALPSLVQRLQTAFVTQSDELLGDLKFWAIVIVVGLFALLILVGVGLYLLVLRPVRESIRNTFADVSKIATALDETAQALETNNAIQRQLLEMGETRGH